MRIKIHGQIEIELEQPPGSGPEPIPPEIEPRPGAIPSAEYAAIQIEELDTPTDNGKPILAFKAASGLDLWSHKGSGDTESVSGDGRFMALLETVLDEQTGHFRPYQWHVYDFWTDTFFSLGTRPGPAVNDYFLWSPGGSDYFDFVGDIQSPVVRRCNVLDDSIIWSMEIPSVIASPDGRSTLYVSWFSESTSGVDAMFLVGWAEFQGQGHSCFLQFDSAQGVQTGSPYWLVNASHELGQRVHNPYCGLGGLVTGLAGVDANVYWMDFDGQGFREISARDNQSSGWVHPTFNDTQSGMLMMSGKSSWSNPVNLQLLEFEQAGVHRPKWEFSPEQVAEVLGPPFGPGSFGYQHGHISRGNETALSFIALEEVEGVRQRRVAIARLDVETGELTRSVPWHGKGMQYTAPTSEDFYRTTRTGRFKGGILWHGQRGTGVEAYVLMD